MKPILTIPAGIIILFLLFIEIIILIFPLILLKIITKKDFSRGWMINWAEKALKYLGVITYKK